jgi:FkbM family methyltransferase
VQEEPLIPTDVVHRNFVTPYGANIEMAVRESTIDYDLAMATIYGDEYGIGSEGELEGWAIDIGTSIAPVAIALSVTFPRLSVLALDVVPENIEMAQINVDLNGVGDRVTVLQRAMGGPDETSRRCYMRHKSHPAVTDGYAAKHRYIANTLWNPEHSADSEIVDMPVTDLGALLDEFGIDEVAFLKVDCEGCEWAVLDSPAVSPRQIHHRRVPLGLHRPAPRVDPARWGSPAPMGSHAAAGADPPARRHAPARARRPPRRVPVPRVATVTDRYQTTPGTGDGTMDTAAWFAALRAGIDGPLGTVLDVGCAEGVMCVLAAQDGADAVLGIGLHPDSLAAARAATAPYTAVEIREQPAELYSGSHRTVIFSMMAHWLGEKETARFARLATRNFAVIFRTANDHYADSNGTWFPTLEEMDETVGGVRTSETLLLTQDNGKEVWAATYRTDLPWKATRSSRTACAQPLRYGHDLHGDEPFRPRHDQPIVTLTEEERAAVRELVRLVAGAALEVGTYPSDFSPRNVIVNGARRG